MTNIVTSSPEADRFEALRSTAHLSYALTFDQLTTIDYCARQIRQHADNHVYGLRVPVSQRRVAFDFDELYDTSWLTSRQLEEDVVYSVQFGHAKKGSVVEVDMRDQSVGLVLGRELERKWSPLTSVGRSFRRRAARLLFSATDSGRDLNLFDNEREIYV